MNVAAPRRLALGCFSARLPLPAARGGEAADQRPGVHAAQRHALAALRAPRLAHRRGGLGGPRGLGERARGDHRHQPPLRAHDVQGHAHHRHQGHRGRPPHHRRAGEGPGRDARRRSRPCARSSAAARSTTSPSPRTRPRATASWTSASTSWCRSSATTIVKDHLSQIYTKNGGEGLNAGTSEDWTIYFVRLPANRIELWSWLESDRLLNPVFREFYSERDVVYEERRMRTESTPLGQVRRGLQRAVLAGQPLQVAGRSAGPPTSPASPRRRRTPTSAPTTRRTT